MYKTKNLDTGLIYNDVRANDLGCLVVCSGFYGFDILAILIGWGGIRGPNHLLYVYKL